MAKSAVEKENFYDVIIVGAGPAGLAASIYASRFNLKNLVLGNALGGTLSEIFIIENYPGIKSTSGMDMAQIFQEQVKALGPEIKLEKVQEIEPLENGFKVISDKNIYKSQAVILALGKTFCRLNIPGEKKFLGKGISYCATCDSAFFHNKIVAVVGGGNAAAQAALLLSQRSSKVYIIYRKEKMRAQDILIDRIKSNPKIKRIKSTNLLEIQRKEKVKKIILDRKYNGSNELILDGVFIEIGAKPPSRLTQKIGIKIDKEGFIVINGKGQTNIKGIFAAGDVTTGSDKISQIVTATSEGAIAAISVYEYLKNV
jgi:thioredoxin reductase (NADPH)